MTDWGPVLVALITVVGGSLVGLAALRRSGSEAGKLTAEATDTIVGSAGDVVKLLREQMAEMICREEMRDGRILQLEVAVGSWEGWAERVLTILDRAMDMLAEEQRVKLESEVAQAKQTRPPRLHERLPRHARLSQEPPREEAGS